MYLQPIQIAVPETVVWYGKLLYFAVVTLKKKYVGGQVAVLRVEYLDGSERIYCHSLDTVIYFWTEFVGESLDF